MKRIIALSMAVATAFALSSCGEEETVTEQSQGTNVTIYSAASDSIANDASYTGEIVNAEDVIISPKVSAKITKINVREGDYVSAGQILAELDSTDMQNSYDSALANYRSALAGYNSVVNAQTAQSSTSAQNALTNAQLNYNTAFTNYNRELSLYNNGQNASVVNAQAAYDSAEENYNRELELYNNGQNASVVNAQTAYDNALAAYNREKNLYDNDTSLVAARNTLESAKENEQRMTELYNIGAVSQVDYDSAVRSTANAQSNYDTLNSQKEATLDSAYAQLVSAQENLNTAQISASAAVDSARNSLTTAQESLKTARLTASQALDNAKNTLTSCEEALEQARENVGITDITNEAGIESSNASLESAKVALNTASSNLANTKIVALSSGYIASKNAEKGQMATAGSPMFTIKNTNNLVAQVSVTESAVSYIEQGTKAVLTVDAAGIKDVPGTVTLVNPTADAQTGMYTVQVSFDTFPEALNEGMFADVKLTLENISDTITIPSTAIVTENDTDFVYIVNEDNVTARKQEIVLGLETDEKAQIISGVMPGERVVVSGVDYLSETNNAINITGEIY